MLSDVAASLVRILAGACVKYLDPHVFEGVNIYFANHTSHLDFAVIWASLPVRQRKRCVPVAAKDYWEKGPVRRLLTRHVVRTLLIDRTHVTARDNPLQVMTDALVDGNSLIVFPEGTRSRDGRIGEFKPGLHHLAVRNPSVPLIPVCLDNLNRILPKGECLPVPLLSSVTFGRSMSLIADEPRCDFLTRARDAIKELAPHAD